MGLVMNYCSDYSVHFSRISSHKLHYSSTSTNHGRGTVPIVNIHKSHPESEKRSSMSMFLSTLTVPNLAAIDSAKALTTNNLLEGAASVYTMVDGSIGDLFAGFLYSAGQQANEAVQDQLSALSFTSFAVIFGAALVTSLSHCTLSVLPLTLGYIGTWGLAKAEHRSLGIPLHFH